MKDNKTLGGFLVFIVMIALTLAATYFVSGQTEQPQELSYNEFLEQVQEKSVTSIYIVETKIYGLYKDTEIAEDEFPRKYDFKVNITNVKNLEDDLKAVALSYEENAGKNIDALTVNDLGMKIEYNTEVKNNGFLAIVLPYLIIAVIMIIAIRLFMKQVDSTNNKAMNFGKSRARVVDADKQKITFANVAGADEEKEELQEIVEFLKEPQRFIDMGARIPKGVLMVGPPGTGKTLLARAVAGEAKVPFLTISGSDFVEMYVGVGASRVRDLFGQAKKTSPSIIFIDEIDAVGRHRGSGMGGGHDEREQTLNQLLVEMDGFDTNEGIIVMAATNRADILDSALLRPGRFDRQISVNYPDVKGREEILKIHSKGKPLADDVKLGDIAKLTPYATGADLENILNESAILAARYKEKEISMNRITEAIYRVGLGLEKKSRRVTPKDLKLVAYHETGHAVLAYLLDNCDPVQEVSIIPRGLGAGGYTATLPEEETSYKTRAIFYDDIAMALGGYAIENLVYGESSTGSVSDLQHVTNMARQMITQYGMSDEIGPVFLSSDRDFMLGREIGHTNNYSEALSAKIDTEIKSIVTKQLERAKDILKNNMDKIEKVVEVLLKKEKINGTELEKILKVEI
ncbi:MAG: ATP-dependent zinc metalloprotease FtsH [Eubacteriales bacterium]